MEKHYEDSNILFLEYGVFSKSLQICATFLPFTVDLAFGKILNAWDESQLYVNGCISSRAKDSISANAQVSIL